MLFIYQSLLQPSQKKKQKPAGTLKFHSWPLSVYPWQLPSLSKRVMSSGQ